MIETWKKFEKERYEALLSGLDSKEVSGEISKERAFTPQDLGDVIESDQVRRASEAVEQDYLMLTRDLERVLAPKIEKTGMLALAETVELSRHLDEIEREADRMLLLSGRSRKAIGESASPEWKGMDSEPGELGFERETGRQHPRVVLHGSLVIPSDPGSNVADLRNGASISVTRRIGLSSQAQRLPIENVIDGSTTTYWEETILSDDMISRKAVSEWDDLYPGIPKEGAFIELEIRFRGASFVSEVDVTPFCRFPIEIVSIVGIRDKEEYVLVSPSEAMSSDERMNFSFPGRQLTGIRLLARQRNAEEQHYWVSEEDAKEQAIWDHQASLVLSTSDSLTIGEDGDTFDATSKWYGYLKRLKVLGEESKDMTVMEEARVALELASVGDYTKAKELYARYLKDGRESSEDRLKNVFTAKTKIAYRYGFASIEVRGARRQRSAVAISKRIPLPATTRDIVLVTDEAHMNKPDSALRGTSVEWYLSNSPSPKDDEWKAILPQGQSHVVQEVLVGGQVAPLPPYGLDRLFFRLRFDVQDNLKLFKDGVAVEESWYGIADDNRTLAMKRELYSPTSVFTVDYRPTTRAGLIRLSEVGEEIPHVDEHGSAGERFSEIPLRKAIILKAAPIKESVRIHVDKEEWTRVEANPGEKQYTVSGSTIEFGEGQGEVRIDYDRFSTDVRLKMVLRQHQGGVSAETPTVNSFTLYTANEKETEHGQIQGTFNAPY